jgi:hypothetical protein
MWVANNLQNGKNNHWNGAQVIRQLTRRDKQRTIAHVRPLDHVYNKQSCQTTSNRPLVVSLKLIVGIGQCSTCLLTNLLVQKKSLPCQMFLKITLQNFVKIVVDHFVKVLEDV